MKIKIPITLSEIAGILDLSYSGNGDQRILGINEIHKVDNGDLTFADIPKYLGRALNSKASVVMVNEKINSPNGKALLYSRDPFGDFNKLVHYFREKQKTSDTVFLQGKDVKLGKNTKVHTGVVIGDRAVIGDNCTIYPNTVIYSGTEIGNNVIIHANTTIGADAFYFKIRDHGYDKLLTCGKVVIEDEVEIGAGCTIDKGVSGETRIGKGSKLDGQVHVGHGVIMGKNCLIAAQVGIGGKTILKNGVKLWGQVGINKGIVIGAGAEVFACSGVKNSLEGDKAYFGIPAREARQAFKESASLKVFPQWIKKVQKRIKKLED